MKPNCPGWAKLQKAIPVYRKKVMCVSNAKIPLYDAREWLPVNTIYYGGPAKLGICIHHQAGSGINLQSIFNSRNVSAHYSVGEGYINQYVAEQDRAWHTGTDYGNTYLIGIETRNDSGDPDWHVSDSAIESLIQCMVGIARNQGWSQLHEYGNHMEPGYVCGHRDLSATACPGPYLYPKIDEIVAEVNKRLKGDVMPESNLCIWEGNQTAVEQFSIGNNPKKATKVKNRGTKKLLTIINNDPTPGNGIAYWEDNGQLGQQWKFVPYDEGKGVTTYYIESILAPGMVIGVANGSRNLTTGSRIQLENNSGFAAQRWTLVPVDGYFYIVNAGSGGFMTAMV